MRDMTAVKEGQNELWWEGGGGIRDCIFYIQRLVETEEQPTNDSLEQ